MADLLTLPANGFPSLLLAAGWFGLLRYFRYSGYGIALLSLCATSLHEACHWLVGWALNAQPASVSLFPKRRGDTWVLGSVGFTNLNLWNSAFVAFAPLAMLPLGYALFIFWMIPALTAGAFLSWFIAGYVVACCFFACVPSTTDIRIGALSGLLYGTVGYGLWCAAH